ncbi:hypothetical protein MTP99_015941 [Tenebrio molitor]|nr:hypothetical protein MTP99_015941 [Tenebrio molitor]
MDASSQTRKGARSQKSLDDKNDICLRGLFKIPPLAPRPAGGTHTFSAAILPMPVSPPCCMQQNATTDLSKITSEYVNVKPFCVNTTKALNNKDDTWFYLGISVTNLLDVKFVR